MSLILDACGGHVGALVLVAPLPDLPRFMRVRSDETTRPMGPLSLRAQRELGRGHAWGWVLRPPRPRTETGRYRRAVLWVGEGDLVEHRHVYPGDSVTPLQVATWPEIFYLSGGERVPVDRRDIVNVVGF